MDNGIELLSEIMMSWGPRILGALAVGLLGGLLARRIHGQLVRQAARRGLERGLSWIVAEGVRVAVLSAALLAALGTLGVHITSLVWVLVALVLAVGFAVRGSLSDLASGGMIRSHRPFAVGDEVTIAGHTGAVAEIGLLATTLHTSDGQKIIIPNQAVTSGTVVNLTTLGSRRVEVAVQVAFGEDPKRAMRVLNQAARTCAAVVPERDVSVDFEGLGDGSMELVVKAWAKSEDYRAARHQIRAACFEALGREGIDLQCHRVVKLRPAAVRRAPVC